MGARRDRTRKARRQGHHRRRAVFQPYENAVRGSGAVDYRDAREAGTVGLKEETISRLQQSGDAIDEHGERSDGAGELKRDRSRLAVGRTQLEPRSIGRKKNMQLRLRRPANAIAGLKVLERRRQLGARRCQQAFRCARQRCDLRVQPDHADERHILAQLVLCARVVGYCACDLDLDRRLHSVNDRRPGRWRGAPAARVEPTSAQAHRRPPRERRPHPLRPCIKAPLSPYNCYRAW